MGKETLGNFSWQRFVHWPAFLWHPVRLSGGSKQQPKDNALENWICMYTHSLDNSKILRVAT